MQYRLALDLGTNSIGWAVYRLYQGKDDPRPRPVELIRLGSRIFSNNDSQIGAGRHPKSGDSLAKGRRIPRGQRRRRDRYIRRRDDLMAALIDIGLMPEGTAERKALQRLNPYEIRARALDERVSPHHLGRALFHLNQRRGFKSNRKVDGDDNDAGKIKQAIAAFKQEMGNARSVGEALFQRQQNGDGTRARLRGSGAKTYYDFYVARDMIEDEFHTLWDRQQAHHPELLTEQARERLHRIIFYQRKLKAPPVGRCTLVPEQPRAPKALPSAQRFRLYQEINHLRLIRFDSDTGETDNHPLALNREQRDQLVAWLERKKTGSYEQLRKQLFGRADAAHYLFEIEASTLGRTKVYGNTTSAALANAKAFGKAWHAFDLATQDHIVEHLIDVEEEDDLIAWLSAEYDLSAERARHIARARLEEGHLRFGREAIGKVLERLENGWQTHDDGSDQPLSYDKAVIAAGYPDHRVQKPEHLLERLPPYNEVLWRHCQEVASSDPENPEERITNPTVHIALNQLRRLVNAVIGKYGAPSEIHIELARELKKSRAAKVEESKRNRLNRERNEALNHALEHDFDGQRANAANRLRLKLFEELRPLNHYCVLSGERIDPSKLFTNAYQIDHILPFSKTLDDGYNNKILVTQRANADKGNRSIEELAQLPDYDWDAIQQRASLLPHHKRKRFAKNAMDDWLGSSGEFRRDGMGFIQRQLTDTAYLSRVAREYLQTVCNGDKIVTSPGRLTALLRGKWGLNKLLSDHNGKNRDDHRHHAIDAAVVGLIDRGLLNAVSKRAARMAQIDEASLFKGIDEELPERFREQLHTLITRCIVSHKPDHNPRAQLHEATAYGIVDGPDDKGRYLARSRVALSELKAKDIDKLQDPRLADRLRRLTQGLSDAEIKEKLSELQARPNWPGKAYLLRKISGVAVALKGTAISPDPRRRPAKTAKLYKGGGNYCYEIYRKDNGRWDGELISTFDANQSDYRAFMRDAARYESTTFDGHPLVMRLINNDIVVIERVPGAKRVMRIQKMSEGMISLCDHFEANVDARNRDKEDHFSYLYKTPGTLQALRARRVRIDMLGRLHDPGFGD